MHAMSRLVCCLIALFFALGLTGCSTVGFENRFGTPVDDETLARFDGVWEFEEGKPILFASRENGWFELVGLEQDVPVKEKGGGPEPGPDDPPKPSVRIEGTVFIQVREFEGHYYAWLIDPEDEEDEGYMLVRISSGFGAELGEGGVLLVWLMNVDRFEQAIGAGELEGTVKGEEGKTVSVTSKQAALERFVVKTPLHEWVVLEEPFIVRRISKR